MRKYNLKRSSDGKLFKSNVLFPPRVLLTKTTVKNKEYPTEYRFKYVLWLMRISGLIFVKQKSSNHPCWSLLWKYLIFIFHGSAFYYIAKEIYMYMIGALTLQMICIVVSMRSWSVLVWMVFYKKRRHFMKLMKELHQLYAWLVNSEQSRMPRINKVFPILVVLMPLCLSITLVAVKAWRQEEAVFELQHFTLGVYSSTNHSSQYILLTFFTVVDNFGSMFFPYSSALMIGFLCLFLNDIYLALSNKVLINFNDEILSKRYLDVLKMYRRIRHVKVYLEELASLPILCLLIQQFSSLFLAVTVSYKVIVLKLDYLILISTLTYTFNAMACITLVILSASSINTSNHKFVKQIRNVVEQISLETWDLSVERSIDRIVKFAVLPEKEELTVWKMMPINRQMMLTCLATLFTYGVVLIQFTT